MQLLITKTAPLQFRVQQHDGFSMMTRHGEKPSEMWAEYLLELWPPQVQRASLP